MNKYRKKPIVIEAWQVNPNLGSAPRWLLDAMATTIHTNGGFLPITIDTLEGTMTANYSDWIIKGMKGELYPCRDDIFTATYEEVFE